MTRLLLCTAFLAPALSAAAQNTDYTRQASALVAQMTLQEKASLCSGKDLWSTRPIDRLGIPSIFMTDGPHGLRKSIGSDFGNSVPATCFPTASALASSWNPTLAWQEGVALGEECQAADVQIILGPGVNMKRSPLGGRNFEYFSEDPILAGYMGTSLIGGEQSQGVGSSLKHFAANNQETDRLTMSSNIDERTLNELYLPAFEMAVEQAHPMTVMCAYNKLNGTYCSENGYLLTDMLRKHWGFSGFVVSDWGAVDDRVAGLKAGLNLEMPGAADMNNQKIVEAVTSGVLPVSTLDSMVTSILAVTLELHATHKQGATFNPEAHHALARHIDGECIVLLKNEGHILPIAKTGIKTVAIIGAFAKKPRYQGAGSSQINPTKLSDAYDELSQIVGPQVRLRYAPGYHPDGSTSDSLLEQARQTATGADLVIVFAGLPESYESEGYDRKDMDLPSGHSRLIAAVAAVQPSVVVVLMNGAAVSMPWISKVKGVVEGWLGGQAGGGALADILTGKVNPSGKLSETFPLRLEDTPPFPIFPSYSKEADYGEGVFTGYRYYDAKKIAPLFPFGFGLSYTRFTYTGISSPDNHIKDTDSAAITITVRNSGAVEGQEVVELYVHQQGSSTVVMPEKELRRFAKVALQPGEEKEVHFKLGYRDFAYYDVAVHDWQVRSGDVEVRVGGSSASLPLHQILHVEATRILYPLITRYSTLNDLNRSPKGHEIYRQLIDEMASAFSGGGDTTKAAPTSKMTPAEQKAAHEKGMAMLEQLLGDTPICKIINFSNGHFTEEKLQQILHDLNQ
jgi:beta-glucosidase